MLINIYIVDYQHITIIIIEWKNDHKHKNKSLLIRSVDLQLKI